MSEELSYRQSQAIRFWIAGQRKSKADALRKAGYSNAVVRQPGKVFNSYVVKKELERLGHGSEGIHNGLEPKAVVLPTKPTTVIELTEENIEKLKDLLQNTPRRNQVPSVNKESYEPTYITNNAPNCNVFGDELYSMPQKECSMSEFSSI
jgi:hypothetical protein